MLQLFTLQNHNMATGQRVIQLHDNISVKYHQSQMYFNLNV